MSILINENLLRSKYLQETGNERPTHEFSKDYSTYVEWLEEKLSMLFQEKHTTRLPNPGGIEIMEYGVIKCIVSSNELLPTDDEILERANKSYSEEDPIEYHERLAFKYGAIWMRDLMRRETK